MGKVCTFCANSLTRQTIEKALTSDANQGFSYLSVWISRDYSGWLAASSNALGGTAHKTGERTCGILLSLEALLSLHNFDFVEINMQGRP